MKVPNTPEELLSIEHIFSQNPDDGTVPDFDIDELWNLTILTLKENGEEVKNKAYAQKRPVYISSTYTINKKFNEYTEWNEESRNNWQQYLLDMACKVFSI